MTDGKPIAVVQATKSTAGTLVCSRLLRPGSLNKAPTLRLPEG